MLRETLKLLFDRDLAKLKSELQAYHDEDAIWKIDGHIANSAGNLCLHLIGNLNAFVGNQLGNTGYERHRDREFSMKGVSRSSLIEQVNQTMGMIRFVLDGLTEERLQEEFPIQVFDRKTTIAYMLVHLSTHLSYHLGQINYHRRLLDPDL